MKSFCKRAVALSALMLALAPAGVAVAVAHPATVHVVRPGESIQAALDRARPGDTVVVRPGTYRENLEMTTDRVTLVGYGATLSAPEVPTHRRCSVAVESESNRFGVCVSGDVTVSQPPTVRSFVHGVTIRGLTITQFPATGIVAFAAKGLRIEHTDVAGGASYGMLIAQDSRDVVVAANRVHGGVSAGIYIGIAPNARATVVGNEVFDSGVYGVFIRDASHGTVTGNVLRDNCIGVGLLPTSPDRSAVTDWRVTANRIHDNNRPCPVGAPVPTGAGVVVAGASDTVVTHNVITDNRPADASTPGGGGGVVLLGSTAGGPAQPVDNRVTGNVLRGNQPYDLAVLAEGTGNRVSGNACATSAPAGLCTGGR